jgi:hypothetical protein
MSLLGAQLGHLPNVDKSRHISVDKRAENIATRLPPTPFITFFIYIKKLNSSFKY